MITEWFQIYHVRFCVLPIFSKGTCERKKNYEGGSTVSNLPVYRMQLGQQADAFLSKTMLVIFHRQENFGIC